MRVVVTIEQRYDRTPDGAVWTDSIHHYDFWRRYLSVFDEVRAVARVQDVVAQPENAHRVDGEGVVLAPVPYYVGPRDYLKRRGEIKRTIRNSVGPEDAVVLRIPGAISNVLDAILIPRRRPFGAEVVADPRDAYAKGGVGHPLRPFFRWLFTSRLRRQCATACASGYVTKDTLQRRYPPKASTFSTYFSSLELNEDAFVDAPRTKQNTAGPLRLIQVSSLTQRYKAVDVVLDAMAGCIKEGHDLTLDILGDGKCRPELERQAAELRLGDRVAFRGHVAAGPAVRAFLDRADIFLLPSRTEGLPRAMIEAMARALPCIGSTAGGMPELLPPSDLVVPGSVDSLKRKIIELARDPQRRTAASARNLAEARQYHIDILKKRRDDFYRHVKESTEAWMRP